MRSLKLLVSNFLQPNRNRFLSPHQGAGVHKKLLKIIYYILLKCNQFHLYILRKGQIDFDTTSQLIDELVKRQRYIVPTTFPVTQHLQQNRIIHQIYLCVTKQGSNPVQIIVNCKNRKMQPYKKIMRGSPFFFFLLDNQCPYNLQ